MEEKKGTKIQALQVGYTIIEVIAHHGQPMKFNEIISQTNVSNGNLYKYLNTLTSLGLLHRDKETGHYSLGSRFIEFGMMALNKEDIVSQTWSILQEVNLKSKETTILTVWSPEGPMIVKMINSSAGLNLGGQVGTYLPLHSATGKLFAAFKQDFAGEDWKQRQRQNLSEVKLELLDEDIEEIRKTGISFAKDALAPSINSIAVPIFNFNEELLGVITVLGFKDSLPVNMDNGLNRYFIEKSKEASRIFGARME
ncbi:IclR family transcriptional regulator [Salibacterium salarium]|nr:IclR family transcriptional regulator [Salibacterium salarium]